MALEVTIVSGLGQEHAGCLLLTSEVLFVVSISEDTQQQAFPITEVTDGSGSGGAAPAAGEGNPVVTGILCPEQVECRQEPGDPGQLILSLQQQTVTSDTEVSLL